MAITTWLDDVAAVWGTIAAGKKKVRSYRAFSRDEFPEAITEFPSCISFVTSCRFAGGGDAGPHILHWTGRTDFFILSGVSKKGAPEVMRYFERIIRAAVLERTLNGHVAEFALMKMTDGIDTITGPVELMYGENVAHLGLVVNWRVKEVLSNVTLGT